MHAFSHVLLIDRDTTATFLHQRLVERGSIAPHIASATTDEEAITLLQDVVSAGAAGLNVLALVSYAWPFYLGFFAAYEQLEQQRQKAIHLTLLTPDLFLDKPAHVAAVPFVGVVIRPLTKDKLQQVVSQVLASA